MTLHALSPVRRPVWFQGAADFFFLQNRHYPRSAALEWVGNRHRLSALERQLLHRGVFAQGEALKRRAKRCQGAMWRQELLVVDGHNVQITLESHLLGRPLLLANDGALRDLAGQSARFRFSQISKMALDILFRFLGAFRPVEVLFLFDAPMSHSGFLAGQYSGKLKATGIRGDARAVPVPEREFPYGECVVAGSDHAVLDVSLQWLDLARWAVEWTGLLQPVADFSCFLSSSSQSPFLDPPLF